MPRGGRGPRRSLACTEPHRLLGRSSRLDRHLELAHRVVRVLEGLGFGANFADMVRDRAEFREWVLDGSSRLGANPLVRFFWRRQKLSMPAYRDRLSDEQVEAIWAWIEAARAVRD